MDIEQLKANAERLANRHNANVLEEARLENRYRDLMKEAEAVRVQLRAVRAEQRESRMWKQDAERAVRQAQASGIRSSKLAE